MIVLAWIGLALGLTSCSCGTSEIRQQRPVMKSDLAADPDDADFLVDFGAVLLGDTVSRRYRIENAGSAGLSVQIEPPAAPFSSDLPSSLSSVDVGGGVEVRFSFSPVEERSTPIEQVIEVMTNEGGGKSYRLRLRGLPVRATLDCEPASLDFGAVLMGTSATMSTRCTNPYQVPIEVSLRTFRGHHAIYFTATAEGISNNLLPIGAGESAEIEIEFRARSAGENTATFELHDHLQKPLGSLSLRANAVSSMVIVESGGCLDFSYVNIGSLSTKELTLVNLGSEDIEIPRIGVPEEYMDDLSVRTPMPIHLKADGGSASVEIAFHPQRGGNLQIALEVWTSDGESAVPACVTGFGGGPALVCSPAARDLGLAGIGYPTTARFSCSNVGMVPEGIKIDPLVVEGLGIDNEVFTPTIRELDGSLGPRAGGYRVGEGFLLEVAYAPVAEAFDEGVVQVQTNVNQVDVRVSGEGRAVEPCDFSISPPSLRFGVLGRGTSRTMEFEIRNNGLTSCIVNNLRLSEDSSPTYSLEEIASVEIEAGGFARFPVTFAPVAYAPSFAGKVLFEISHPTSRFQEVALSGASANGCLLMEPAELDFGAGMPGCLAIQRDLTLSNICSTPLEITSVELGDAPDLEDFSIIRAPTMPLVLQPQGYFEVLVGFDPLVLGEHRGTLVVELAASPAVEDNIYVATLEGEGSQSSRQTDDFTGAGRPMIDVLWVIDNSGSMSSYQELLQENLPAFMSFATAQRADFQIGVTTTALIVGGSGCPGGAEGAENGRLFPVDGSHPRILTPYTPNLETHWKHNMAVGTCFGPNEESALEGAFQALSPPLINETKDSRYNTPYMDGNAGFLRPGASLSVILVSDARDYSPQATVDYIDFFFDLKRGRRDMVRVHAISGPRASQGGCGQPGDKMIDVVEATQGKWLSLCTPTSDKKAWSEALEEMSKGVFAFARRHVLRGFPGDVNGDGEVNELDIELRLNGKIQPSVSGTSKVWTYDSNANAIDFRPLFIPKTGTAITASYDLVCH